MTISKCNHEDTKAHEAHEENLFFFVILRDLRAFVVPAAFFVLATLVRN
jgi:hypothetical protein